MDIFIVSGPSSDYKKLAGCIFILVIEMNIPPISYHDAVRNDSLI